MFHSNVPEMKFLPMEAAYHITMEVSTYKKPIIIYIGECQITQLYKLKEVSQHVKLDVK